MGRSYLPEAWQRDANVSPAARCLMGVLSSYATSESGDQDVWPSPTTVAKDLGMGQRHIRRLGDELENAGWLTRIYEKSVRGGTDLTWRIHFPVISRTGYGADTERTHKSVEGPNRRTRSGYGADTEGTHRSARIEGEKVGRDEGSSTSVDDGSLTLTAPEPKKKPRFQRPPFEDVWQALVDKGMRRDVAEREADKFLGYYDANGWRVGRNPMKSWKGAVATWYRNWQERNPQELRRSAPPPPDLRGPDGTISQWGPGGDPYANGSKR